MMLKSLRIQNLKAVRNSGVVKLGPLTAFIGNNGTDKQVCEYLAAQIRL